MLRIGPVLLALLACARPGLAQTEDDLRAAISDALRKINFASNFTGLVAIADELELSTATLDFDDESGTEVKNTGLPFNTVLAAFGESPTKLYLEGVIGYARLTGSIADIWGDSLPGAETRIDAKYRTYSLYFGAGPSFRLAEGLTLAPILNVGLARLESEATYSGPGADFTAELLDGIAFNWDSYVWSAGGALRVDWEKPLGGGHNLSLIGRYDLRWFGSFDEDDPAQEVSDRAQLVTLRADVVGRSASRFFSARSTGARRSATAAFSKATSTTPSTSSRSAAASRSTSRRSCRSAAASRCAAPSSSATASPAGASASASRSRLR